MNIFIGADHRGYNLKNDIIKLLEKDGHTIGDVGTHQDKESCDYPQFAQKVAESVAKKPNARGILVCMTGIGHSIAANKVPGVYAALCYNQTAAKLSREHNNSNVLVLGSKFVTKKEMMSIIRIWLKTKFEGGRHLRRVNQIKKIEKKFTRK